MQKWEIDKTFDFCYGHRVWSQELKEGYATDLCLACRHLHGHQGQIKVFLRAEELTDGMVTDFKHLGWFKKWLDDELDHKFIMDLNDPLLQHEVPFIFNNGSLDIKTYLEIQPEGHYKIIEQTFLGLPQPLIEKYEGMVFVNFVPTSENLSKWLYDVVHAKMSQIGVQTVKVEFNETPKSRSTYIND